MLLSAFSALSLSPALSSMLLKPHKKSRGPLAFCFRQVQPRIRVGHQPLSGRRGHDDPPIGSALVGLAVFWGAGRVAVQNTAGRIPARRRSRRLLSFPVRLPDGASIDRTEAAVAKIEEQLRQGERRGVLVRDRRHRLRHANPTAPTWRPSSSLYHSLGSAQIKGSAAERDSGRGAARASPMFPKPSPSLLVFRRSLGLSNTGGFQFMLEDRAAASWTS